jgi:hypothetical protein
VAKKRKNRLTSNVSLGGEQAEADPLLQHAFYESGDYKAIESRIDPHCFVLGRTGGGKSAALQQLEQDHRNRVVRINPEDLALPYITDLGVVRYLASLNVHLDPLFIALWKHVLLVELIRHRYNVDSPAAKQNFLNALRERIRRDPSKRAALDYLDEFEGKFWAETDERVREITQKFERQVKAEAGGRLGLEGAGDVEAGIGGSRSSSAEVRSEQAERFQRIVNETQLARLNQMIGVLDEDILDSQHFTYIVIDDLDRDWVDEAVANTLIRCLFRTVVDLKRVENLKVLVALRTNIFEQLQFRVSGGAQEEKFRALILRMRWTPGDLKLMLDERARAAAQIWNLPHIKSVRDLLPYTSKTRGRAIDHILARGLMRPRDAIAFINESLRLAAGKSRISWDQFDSAEKAYSHGRLLALRDEWKLTYPGMDGVLELFRGAVMPMPRDVFQDYLDRAMLLPADPDFEGVVWMTALSEAMWSPGPDPGWMTVYGPLLALLINIGFVGCAESAERVPLYSHDDPDLLLRPSELEAARYFCIHPAFRAELEIQSR